MPWDGGADVHCGCAEGRGYLIFAGVPAAVRGVRWRDKWLGRGVCCLTRLGWFPRPDRPTSGVCVMWVATRRVQTACGSVDAGRLVPDGDPMLDGAPAGAFVRVVDDTPNPVVEEATAEPGKVRRTSRRAQ